MPYEKTHIIRQGESAEQLSARYGLPVCMLARANRALFERGLRRGDVLNIPPRSFCALRSYTVQTGDTVYSIAKRCGSTMRELMRINGLSHSALKEGSVLTLPPRRRVYVAGATDTLESICLFAGADIRTVRELNGVDEVYSGMQLFLP